MLFDGGEFGHEGEVHVGSEEEMDFLGIPGLLEPDQMRELLRQRQSDRRKKAPRAATGPRGGDREELTTHEQLAVLRRELNGLVAAWHHRTGQAHGITHAALRKECGGPPPPSPTPSSCARASTGSASGPARPDSLRRSQPRARLSRVEKG